MGLSLYRSIFCRAPKDGFTLIEFVMVIVILGIIGAVTVPLLVEISRGWVIVSEQSEMAHLGRIAMDRMVREIREVKNLTSVAAANSTYFAFNDSEDRSINFSKSGTLLRRTVDGSTDVLAPSLSALTLTYFDVNGSVVASPVLAPNETNIRRVGINTTFSVGSSSLSFSSQVAPRRLQ